jgi:AcrR family transcriptional regulator
MGTSATVKRRRRGADLEIAILETAWAELVDHGYAGLTLEGVALRAGTSRPVLARRWDNKAALTIAAIRHQMAKYPLEVSDQGDVRKELLAYLEYASERATGMIIVMHPFLLSDGLGVASSPKELHRSLLDGEKNALAAILQRAVERGDIDLRKLIPPVAALLSDLFRHHVLMNLSAPSRQLRETWVDAIFLPLVRPA